MVVNKRQFERNKIKYIIEPKRYSILLDKVLYGNNLYSILINHLTHTLR